ncbi:alpha/beta fold hydrolase [Nocardia concava]|uniref:alpha/beta fold hydrolase n=1 Tax=Nocardia concava TaxID=257281 RepID=UPI0002DC69FA|nr:alpha/beta fold hydrolase [Nocardia concava]
MEPPCRSFDFEGHRLAYDIRGSGAHSIVLVPGLLMPRRMHERLADALHRNGFRVVTLEPLGWGESDKPRGYQHYSMGGYARQVIALLDELGIARTVLFGTSAGANIALATAALAPDRLCGMITESPVLERAVPACAAVGFPALLLGRYGAPLVDVLGRGADRIPRRRGGLPDLGLSWIAQDSRVSADVVQGIVYGGLRVPRAERTAIATRTLVIGHRFDPIHPIADDRALVRELRDTRFLRSSSIVELRRDPRRLLGEITDFARACWSADPAEVAAPQAPSTPL